MSVKFEKETVRDTLIPGGRKHEIAHEIGERLTGGESAQGYLAVRESYSLRAQTVKTDNACLPGLPCAAPKEPSPH